jgi:tetratricopeptide (TPR) repeat protein
MRYVCLLGWSLVAVALANSLNNVRGELSCDNCLQAGELYIELRSPERSFLHERAAVAPTGSFSFSSIPDGSYLLSVTNSRGTILQQELVSVGQHFPPLNVRLALPKKQAPSSGAVSVRQLQHEVPGKARKEFKKAEQKLRKGDLQGSVEHLLAATVIDPEYMEAFNNLGSRYMMLDRPADALQAFEQAIRLDPQIAMVHANAAIALLSVGKFAEAEATARKTLELDASDNKGRYVLGLSLFARYIYSDEACEALRRTADAFPQGRLALAKMLVKRGAKEEAKQHLALYLDSGVNMKREQAKAMLSSLR